MGAGYTGKILMVDLTNQKSEAIELDDKVYQDFLGGYGLGAKILMEQIPKGADPLGQVERRLGAARSGAAPRAADGLADPICGRQREAGGGGASGKDSRGYLRPALYRTRLDRPILRGRGPNLGSYDYPDPQCNRCSCDTDSDDSTGHDAPPGDGYGVRCCG